MIHIRPKATTKRIELIKHFNNLAFIKQTYRKNWIINAHKLDNNYMIKLNIMLDELQSMLDINTPFLAVEIDYLTDCANMYHKGYKALIGGVTA